MGTGRPVWFCNMHNHARFLRDRRPCSVPEVGMTDVYFGDLSPIPGEMLNKINEVCEKNIVTVPMKPGDVLLCDNYRVLHGRDIFEGDRLHAVSWFGDEKLSEKPQGTTPGGPPQQLYQHGHRRQLEKIYCRLCVCVYAV